MLSYLRIPLFLSLPFFGLISSDADDFRFSDIGLRVGFDAENRANVQSYELISTLETPWSWSTSDRIELDLSIEFGLGALDGKGEMGLLAHVGPSVEIKFGELPLELIISSGPALLSEDEFDQLDLGGSFQFTSAVGFDIEVSEDWTLGYRYLHISNAGLHDVNPGMDLHALSLFYAF